MDLYIFFIWVSLIKTANVNILYRSGVFPAINVAGAGFSQISDLPEPKSGITLKSTEQIIQQ